ncbi:MAG: hypothetical protein AAGM22_09795 [Acidobacteriota bacterium]
MEYRVHPSFGRFFLVVFSTSFLASAAAFIGGFVILLGGGQTRHAMASFGLFLVIKGVAATVIFRRLFRIRCPECGGATRTVAEGAFWRAVCDTCQVSWRLTQRLIVGKPPKPRRKTSGA